MTKTKEETIDTLAELNLPLTEEEEKEWFSWIAAERPYKQRDKDFWITVVSILILVSVIFAMVGEMFLVLALVSVLFLFYVLSTVPPENVKYRLTNRGVYFGELHYPWDDLERFWFKKTLSCDAVFLETKLRFPRQVSLITHQSDQALLKDLLKKKLPLITATPSFVDKLTDWFAQRLPLESRDTKTK